MKAVSRLLVVLWALRPRRAAALAALAVIGWAFGYLFSQETPVGNVRGQVVLAENGKSLSGADITLQPVSKAWRVRPFRVRYAESGHGGWFSFSRVPAGIYYVSASSRAHSASNTEIYVDEGGTALVTLPMTRSEGELTLEQHQRAYGSAETAHFAVSGYANWHEPIGGDTLRLRVFRTRLSAILPHHDTAEALDAVGRSYDPATVLPAALLHPLHAPAPPLVTTRDVRISGADKEGFFYQQVGLGKPGAGLYLVDVTHDKKTVCAWLLVTDTALIVKRAHRQLVAYAVDMRSGSPLPGAAVRSYRNGKIAASGTTDTRGLAELHLATLPASNGGSEGDAGESDTRRLTTVAVRGADEAVVARDIYGNEDADDFVLHADTDRPIYRPGQRIYFKGIARRRLSRQAEPGTTSPDSAVNPTGPLYSVPTGEPVAVEIRDPSGDRLLERRLTTNGFGSFFGSVDLDAEAATGVYSLIMTVRGEKHTHDIVVASYQKPEFAVTVTSDKPRYAPGEPVTVTVDGEYYFGAPVAGAKVRYDIYRSPDWAAEYADTESTDDENDTEPPLSHSYGESDYGQTVLDGETRLDENGKAVLTFPAQASKDPDGPQAQVYTVSVTVTAAAEREVTTDATLRVTTGDFRLAVAPDGYVASPNQPAHAQIVARDYDGKPMASVPISVEFGYEEWKQEKYEYHPAGTQTLTTDAMGAASLNVVPPHAGELLIKARAKDAHGRSILGRASVWVTDDRGGDLETEYADLSLLSDKRRYAPGDTARILLNAASTGETVLLTIEGERVYHSQLVPMTQRSRVLHIPILAQYGPNVFLDACYVRDKKYAHSEIPLRVALPQRDLKIAVHADRTPPSVSKSTDAGSSGKPAAASLARYAPGDKITYTVQATDAAGRPAACEFSLGVVDESIYALREDSPTALRDAFYPHRENDVETNYSFAIEYLGDADKAEPQISARKKFPDTAYWKPVLHTDAQGRASVTFALPDSLTTWRATVLAQTRDTRVGRAVAKVITAKAFFVRVEMPRFLTQQDKSQIVALVHNETGTPQTALVRLRADNLTLTGDPTQTLTVAPGAIGQATWPVAAVGTGTAPLRITAWTPRATGRTAYTDGVETTLPIRAHGREQMVAYAGELTASAPETEVFRLDPQAIPAESRLTVRITPSVASALVGALDYLIGFPYGCTEQTMSRFLPDLLVQRALKRNGMQDVEHANALPRMVRAGLLRLYRFQHKDTGGWGWWEHDSDDPWMTAYVLYGLAEAQAQGVPVNKDALGRGRKAAEKLLAKTKPADRPFLLYGLALAGGKDVARAQKRLLTLNTLDSEQLAYLLLLDKLLGESTADVSAALDSRAVSEDGLLHWKGRDSWEENDRLATAIALRALLAGRPQDARISAVLRWLMTQRTGEYWSSTRDTSGVLAAFCDYLATRPVTSTGGDVQIKLNGQLQQTVALTPDNRREQEIVLRVPASALRPEKNDVTLQRTNGTSSVFYSVEMRQTVAQAELPAMLPAGTKIERAYLRIRPRQAGQDSWALQTEPTNNTLQQGDHIRVRLTINVPRDMAYVLIEDPFPAGCEPMERGDAEELDEWSYWWSSIDVRDDRVAFFARTLPKGKHVIEYNLRAQTPGSYHTLPTLVQAMYAPESRAESAETRVEVK